MNDIDITTIVNPWQAAVVIVLILVVLGLPQVQSWRNAAQAKKISQDTKDQLDHEVNPNSGGSLRDAVDRIEVSLGDVKTEQSSQADRLAALESTAANSKHWWGKS